VETTEKIDTGKANILIVDDRPDKLVVFKTVLEELEQNIITAQSGDEALRWLLEHEAAVILLDVNMPGMDGLETAALIRARKKSAHIPIIFITAYADEIHTARGYSLGAVDYILAPVVPGILRSKVKVFVQLFHLTQQIRHQANERIALAQEQAARAIAEESTRRANFVAEASKVMSSSLDVDAVLKGATQLTVPFLADMSLLTLLDDSGRMQRSELAWTSGSRLHTATVAIRDGSALARAVEQAISSGNMALRNDMESIADSLVVTAAAQATETQVQEAELLCRHLTVFPLKARGRTRGVLALGLGSVGRHFERIHLAMAEDIALRAAIALDNCLLYRDIQAADERKNEFLAMLAHELRNPLAPILNSIEVMRAFPSNPQKLEWARNIVDRQLRQLVRLVDDLLDVSRITRGKIHLKMGRVDVRSVIAAAVETSLPLIELYEHEFSIFEPPAPIWVNADVARLSQIISNLLNNAAKFTEKGGRISLQVETQGDQVLFLVRDSGIGIPQDMLANIFELFTQAHQTLDRTQGGLGIGLTLVRQLVELHGGSVQAFSAGPGTGSEFLVRLPVAAQPHEAPAPATTAMRARKVVPRRILVVEDNINSAEMLAALLQIDGHDVQVAHEGPIAVETARTFRPAVVLLDIGLPKMDGFEVARQLRGYAETREATLIAVSGYGQAADRQRSKDAGFDHHLVKPVDRKTLTSLLASFSRDQTTR
jgi:signal transduction histidine kinase/DNA-binding response OmpR family regulator